MMGYWYWPEYQTSYAEWVNGDCSSGWVGCGTDMEDNAGSVFGNWIYQLSNPRVELVMASFGDGSWACGFLGDPGDLPFPYAWASGECMW
jgi:hypothetical protein